MNTKKPKKKTLAEQIEVETGELTTIMTGERLQHGAEEFVPGLLDKISKELVAPEIDLTTQESAQVSLELLKSKLQEIERYQNQVRSLKNILLEN